MDMRFTADGHLHFLGKRFRCAFGRGGVQWDKKEGDGTTPAGVWPLRRVLYRKDRLSAPESGLPLGEIAENDGWCDDPEDRCYNQPVTLPYEARAEALWRDDHLYDVMVVLGYNDSPPVPGRGSAVFFHLAHENYRSTEGCLAVSLADMRVILKACDTRTRVVVQP
jgi:L,D-peptidoglycan transpeptidase YkuD (ErfK/YbiS/YcfS/YnhG family)